MHLTGVGPTFVTQVLQLYEDSQGCIIAFNALVCETAVQLCNLYLVECNPVLQACQTLGNIPLAMLTLGGHS